MKQNVKDRNEPSPKTYIVNGILGNVEVQMAPLMHFSLLIDPEKSYVSGIVNIAQAMPFGDIVVKNLNGCIDSIDSTSMKTIKLNGAFLKRSGVSESIIEQFSAQIVIDETWKGNGLFNYGSECIKNVPIHTY